MAKPKSLFSCTECGVASPFTVVPAQAGTQCLSSKSRWIPAFAGMTKSRE